MAVLVERRLSCLFVARLHSRAYSTYWCLVLLTFEQSSWITGQSDSVPEGASIITALSGVFL